MAAAPLRHRVSRIFRRSHSDTDHQIEAFRASQAALGRACAANRPLDAI